MSEFWKGKRVLITAGPTREHLDPIRFLTNASSGRMGFSLAEQAARAGARVVVVAGPNSEAVPPKVRVVRVVSGLKMYRETLRLCGRCDVVIGAAAVSDWRFQSYSPRKIKRSAKSVRLTMVPNPDIIKEVARRRKSGSRQLVVGFALETHGRLAHAKDKLKRKGLDLVVGNSQKSLSGDVTAASIVFRGGPVRHLPEMSKRAMAREILKAIEQEWRRKN